MRLRRPAARSRRRSLAPGAAGLIALFLLGGPSRAQYPIIGNSMADDCVTLGGAHPLDTVRPILFGFHWRGPVRDPETPDVLFDESWWDSHSGDGPRIGNGYVGDPVNPSWAIPPNWCLMQRPGDVHDVIVIARDRLWYDSAPWAAHQFHAVGPQRIGVVDGDGPDVVTLAERHAIRWRPLLEYDPTSGNLGACARAGIGPRGFVVGYTVWSLPAATFPSPTPLDFLRFGLRTYADLSDVDFFVPDDDGTEGSDRDPTDGLRLINPDGLPDTGDEILDLHACPEGGLARWYSVQPVVTGTFSYYDGGLSSNVRIPSALVDVTGDAVPDVADILVDGLHEFSDGCGEGLGLLYMGGIATSLVPGLGEDLASDPGCSTVPCDRGSRFMGLGGVYEPSALDLRAVRPLTVQTGPAMTIVVAWEESLDDAMIYIGDLRTFSSDGSYSHVAVNPCAPISGSSFSLPTPPGDAYFLVTTVEGTEESSYGRDSSGRERPDSEPCP